MPRRFAASSAFALALSIPALALADVPPADGGVDTECTVAAQSVAGSTCAECAITGADTACQVELGSDYNFACQYSATVQIWCNGPARTATPSAGCALPGSALADGRAGCGGVATLTALLGVAAWSMRRRRR